MSSKYSDNLKPVVTAKEMAEIDRFVIEKIGIPGMVLMENAGREVVVVIREMLGTVVDKNINIFCGKGNNGGDGFVIARHLANVDIPVETKLERLNSKRVTSKMGFKASDILKSTYDLPMGSEIPFEIDGDQYAAKIELHYHTPQVHPLPWGWHRGISLFAVVPVG